ncbi:hypothetical protein PIB30_075800 [Stylosanthes scabra]|uniref:Uncharacterized protein n=1 Tax=Stylosanthes scabra TaxID=79078 RepID=A0ABU6TQI4_9FABA|nr:hypothetical protein [Stylosanthes scabra]
MLFNSKLETILADFESKYQETSRPPYPPFFGDYIGREVLFKIERRRDGYAPYTYAFNVVSCCCDVGIIKKFKDDPNSARILQPDVFSPIVEDLIQKNDLHDEVVSIWDRLGISLENMLDIEVDFQVLSSTHDLKKPGNPIILVGTISSLVVDSYWYRIKLFVTYSGSCDVFVFHDQDDGHLMGKSCTTLLKENAGFNLSEILKIDANIYLSKLIVRKLVMMVDPDRIEDNVGDVGYQVFKSSNDPSLIKLFQLAEKGAIKKKVGSAKSGQKINNKKRLYTLYDDVPRLVKQKLENAFNICVTAAEVGKLDQN